MPCRPGKKKLHLIKLAEKYDYVFQWALENLKLFWLGINGQNVFQREIYICINIYILTTYMYIYINCFRSCKSQRCSIYRIATNYYKCRQKYCVNFKVGSGAVLMLITLNEWYTYDIHIWYYMNYIKMMVRKIRIQDTQRQHNRTLILSETYTKMWKTLWFLWNS